MVFSCGALAQLSTGVPDATLNIEGFVLDEPCTPVLSLSKQLVTPYIVNLSALSSTLLLTDSLGPVSKFSLNVDQRKTNPNAKCVGADFGSLPLKLVFDSDLASIAPRTGLLRNSASNRPAQNVFVQLGLIDEAGVFIPIDLNKPQTLNKALNQEGGKTLTLGIRYLASRSLLNEVASLQATNPGSQDVTAGNVSVFLPFLLKLN